MVFDSPENNIDEIGHLFLVLSSPILWEREG
jgi:hypothetical protein